MDFNSFYINVCRNTCAETEKNNNKLWKYPQNDATCGLCAVLFNQKYNKISMIQVIITLNDGKLSINIKKSNRFNLSFSCRIVFMQKCNLISKIFLTEQNERECKLKWWSVSIAWRNKEMKSLKAKKWNPIWAPWRMSFCFRFELCWSPKI